jgi:hypothetical protein
VEHGHGPRFWALLEDYPRTERARGFLEGFSAARDGSIGTDLDDDHADRVDDTPAHGVDVHPGEGTLYGIDDSA